jgi:hypothetical protein
LVEAYQTSGLSAPRFAALHGLNDQTLISWIKKGKEPAAAKHSPSPNPAWFSLVFAEVDQRFCTLFATTNLVMTKSEKQRLLDEIAKRDEIIARQAAEILILRQNLDALSRRIFGVSSERIDPGQGLFEAPPPQARLP